jgi:GNAT superfamily N-acetyltransferase
MSPVHIAQTDDQVRACYATMRELRPHLADADDLLARVRRQRDHGLLLAYVEHKGEAVACAGYRITEFLAWGKVMYVDDLVSRETDRHQGHGKVLLGWLIEQAQAAGCDQFHLDSGTHRLGAHQFYFRMNLAITAFHFALTLEDRPS